MLRYLMICLGLGFSVSHVMTIPVGITLKIPELILMVMIFCVVSQGRIKFFHDEYVVVIAFFFALVLLPFISDLTSILFYKDAVIGANMLGFTSQIGRKDPALSPWVLLVWNLFSFLTMFSFLYLNEKSIRLFIKMLFVSLFLLSIYGIAHAVIVNLKGFPDIPWPTDSRHEYFDQLRAQSFFIEPLNLAHFLLYTFPIYFLFGDLFKTKFYRFLFVKLGMILSGILFVLTFSTSGLIALVVGYSVSLIVMHRMTIGQAFKYGMAFIAFLGVSLFIPPFRRAFIDKIVLGFSSPEQTGSTFIERVQKLELGWNIIKEHPFFGVGLNNSAFYYPTHSPATALYTYDTLPFPLNDPVRIASETGMFGLVGMTIAFVIYLFYLRKYLRSSSNWVIVWFMGGFLATLIASNFSVLLNVYFVWAFVGISLLYIRLQRIKNRVAPV